jgi:membrane peptidoglycan carboxypeptidase
MNQLNIFFVSLTLLFVWLSLFFAPTKKISFSSLRPPSCTEIINSETQKITNYKCPSPKRVQFYVPLSKIAGSLKETVVFLEDSKFYWHSGFDFQEIWNAVKENFHEKKYARGASTITQQLAKNLFLNKEKSLVRKAREVPFALSLEEHLSKRQILELYLNCIEWGPGIYGAEAASRTYFDKKADDLNLYESWMLALIIPQPKELLLWNQPKGEESLMNRAENLIDRLALEKRWSQEEKNAAHIGFKEWINTWKNSRPDCYACENRTYPFILKN